MKTLFTLFLAFIFHCSFGQVTKEQLIDVNTEWKNISWTPSTALGSSANHEAKIKVHLLETVEYLKYQSTSHLDYVQLTNREQLVNTLKSYALSCNFPQNEHKPYKTPIFIDNYGTHCAVGFLMQQSGSTTLANTIRQDENLAYVRDITTKGVAHWAKKHGFTIDELALIQPTYFEPVNSVYRSPITTENPSKQIVSEGKNLFILLEDSLFGFNNKEYASHYIVAYNSDENNAVSCNYPSSAPKPHTIAVSGGILYAPTTEGLYYATIQGRDIKNLEWQLHSLITEPISNISTIENSIYFTLENKPYSLVYDNKERTLDTCFGTRKSGKFYSLDEGLSKSIIYLERNGNETNIHSCFYYPEWEENWVLRVSEEPNNVLPFMVKNAIFYNGSNVFAGDIRINNQEVIGGLYFENIYEQQFGDIFDSLSASEDWHVNDIISNGNRLFVFGRFEKSRTVTNLPGRAIIELTRQGSYNFYPLPVTEIFEEVYAATLIGNKIFLSTNKGYYFFKFRLATSPSIFNENINLYPNPIASGKSLTVDLADIKSIQVINNLGQIVLESTSNKIDIPTSTKPGIYYCTIATKEGVSYNEKIIVE